MKALVTGGGGFLGRRIVELLLARGDEVVFCSRGRYPAVEALGATWIQADLADLEQTKRAVAGCDVVFHVAAKADPWGSEAEFRRVNVDGTANVIAACREAGVKRLIYTSTPSVVSLMEDCANGPQDLPYSDHYESPYGATKAEAERLVLAANGPGLATVSIRPHLVIGPREDKMVPRLLERAKTGKLPIIGDGENEVDLTYVDNAAWAHLDAEQALVDHTAPCAGKAYFLSNDEPVKLWHWLDGFVQANGLPPLKRTISYGLAWTLAGVIEWIWRTFGLKSEPRLTRQQVAGIGRTHWYDMTPAKRDFGYRVRVTMDEGTKALVQWCREGKATATTVDGETITYAP